LDLGRFVDHNIIGTFSVVGVSLCPISSGFSVPINILMVCDLSIGFTSWGEGSGFDKNSWSINCLGFTYFVNDWLTVDNAGVTSFNVDRWSALNVVDWSLLLDVNWDTFLLVVIVIFDCLLGVGVVATTFGALFLATLTAWGDLQTRVAIATLLFLTRAAASLLLTTA